MDAVLTEHDGCRIDALITDLSKDGFWLQSRAELVSGEEVELQVQKRAPVRGNPESSGLAGWRPAACSWSRSRSS
jgi:hypothetical protein